MVRRAGVRWMVGRVALFGMILVSMGAVVLASDGDDGDGKPKSCERRLVDKTFE
jgi:hypothetical protein